MPFWNIFVMLMAILSSMAYANFAVFRKDLQFDNYPEYLNDLAEDWHLMYYFSQPDIIFFNRMEIFVEIIFFLVFLMRFFTEYEDIETQVKVRDISKITKRYLSTEVIYDVLPLIPFGFLFSF